MKRRRKVAAGQRATCPTGLDLQGVRPRDIYIRPGASKETRRFALASAAKAMGVLGLATVALVVLRGGGW